MSHPHQLNLMKMALSCVDDAKDMLGHFSCCRPITLQDLNKPTAEVMIHVVASLLSFCDPSFNTSQSQYRRLTNFERFGLSNNATFTAKGDYVFKAARKFFPPDDDTLNMSLFIRPEDDVKKAKEAITYLVGYLLISEQVNERFEQEWNALNVENQEKSRLHAEVEDLKNEIAEVVINLQSNKDAKPQYEKDLVELENLHVEDLSELAAVEDALKVHKRNYDEKAMVNQRLKADLSNLNAELEHLKSFVVPSPEELQHLHKSEIQNFKDDLRKRDALGTQLKQVGQQVHFLAKLIEKADASVHKFQELINIIRVGTEMQDELNRSRREYDGKKKESEEVTKQIGQVDLDQNRLQNEINKRMIFFEEEFRTLENTRDQKQGMLEHSEFQLDETATKLEEIEHDNERMGVRLKQSVEEVYDLKNYYEKMTVLYRKQIVEIKARLAEGLKTFQALEQS